MKCYIRSSACISPQNTFGDSGFLTDVVEYTGIRLKAIEPDYKEFIDPKLIRRMSHIIKMGVAAAMQCLKNGHSEMPGAIVTGTAFGCLEDTVTFLSRTISQNEELLPPTAFIQSTHNTVAAQIALMLGCHQYNNTFVHKGISFESALIDALMLLNEEEADNILVGGADEMTDTSFTVLDRLGLYKRWPISNLELYETLSKGSIGGEGAAFFLLTDKPSTDNLAGLTAVSTFYNLAGTEEIERKISDFLSNNSLKPQDIDLVISGKNGDTSNDEIYGLLANSIFSQTNTAVYKHLSGEYPTSPAFALWLAANILKSAMAPKTVVDKQVNDAVPKKILIFNHYLRKYYSLMLVSAI
jgi:3-oxoacyl-[acyl-carrier-protein] synthase II